jgi:23S rRNA (cytosine1962-C5)-methyltransferase
MSSSKQKSASRLKLRVSPTAETILRGGHPWLFAESIREQNREGQLGELAIIYDRNDAFLAIGLFDPDSPLRVRMLHFGKPKTLDAAWWKTHFNETIARRTDWFDAQTTGYRLINGESERWPGLVLDRYADTLVLKLYTAAWLPRLDEVLELIATRFAEHRLVLRFSRNIQSLAQKQFHLGDGQVLRGPALNEPVVFLENGLRFESEVLRGQKTGFFLDQRENRKRVESLARNRDVLNAFSFSGGFSLYAARGDARSVTDLDISAHALESARRNFALNCADAPVARCLHETIQADAFEWLAGNTAQKFDLIILDPPSLAKRESERAGAIHAYGKLARHGLAHLKPGGILVAASCSAHVSEEEFFKIVYDTARQSGRRFQKLETATHAPDHPATFLEARYLKCIFLRFE